jgi:hypothetical protein
LRLISLGQADAEIGRTVSMMLRPDIALALIRVRSVHRSITACQVLKPVSAGHSYKTQLLSASNSVSIGPGATRGLIVHPVGMSLFTPRRTHIPALTYP